MGLFSNLISRLFKSKKHLPSESSVSDTGHVVTEWRRNDQERNALLEIELKGWLVEYIRQKDSLHFTWESGNDEAFLYFAGSADEEPDNFEDLEMYLIYKLDIPDAGEFEMNGQGKLYLKNNTVRAEYHSTFKTVIDFDEEKEEEIWSEAEEESNDKELFVF